MLEAILLGVIQGLSEFLPISSSGHLALAMHLLDWQDPPMVLSLVVHVGTLMAVCVIYGKDLLAAIRGALRLVAALFRGEVRQVFAEDEGARLAVWIVVATIPTGVVALLIKKLVEEVAETPALVGGMMIFCGAFLLASRWIPVKDQPLTLWRVLLFGLVQGLAVFPGISRSGSTIVAGLAMGLGRAEAARFSFLASIPAIVGASILEIDLDVVSAPGATWGYVAAGVAAVVTGIFALGFLVRLVRRGALWWFALYMLPLGTVVVLWLR